MFIAVVNASKKDSVFSIIVSEDENEMYFRVKLGVRYPTGW